MDGHKWIDNVLCLNEAAKKILLGLHAIKLLLKKKSGQVEKDLVVDNYIFKPIRIKEQKFPDLQVLMESHLSSSRKSIIKSFPNGSIRVIHQDSQLHQKLKPIYEILCHTVDYLEFSKVCIQQSLKFCKLSVISFK